MRRERHGRREEGRGVPARPVTAPPLALCHSPFGTTGDPARQLFASISRRTPHSRENDTVDNRRLAVECKAPSAPTAGRGLRNAMADPDIEHAWIAAPVEASYALAPTITVAPLCDCRVLLLPLNRLPVSDSSGRRCRSVRPGLRLDSRPPGRPFSRRPQHDRWRPGLREEEPEPA